MDQTTELLTSYAYNLSYEDLSPEAVHQVKRTVIDTLGCAMGGYLSEPAKIARHSARDVESRTAPSRILGTEDYSSMDLAGFANGVMVRYLDCNDSYFSPGGGHPSDMIPAALAAADTFKANGQTFITAVALAYEIFCKISDQVPESGWDQGIFSVIGAACAAGKVMGLDQEQLGHAISLAVVPNIPLRVTRAGELSMWKGCAAASATRAGIFAAQLARQGMTGPFEPFEGRKGLWESALGRSVEIPTFTRRGTEGLGGADGTFKITQTIFKFFPSQIHTQAPIGLALELRSKVDVSEIESIHINSYHSAVSSASTEPEKWDPKTRETADHSIPFLVAAALQDGDITPATFTSQRITDAALRPLLARMTIEEDAKFTEKYPAEYNCRIEIKTRSGQTHIASTSFPKGHGNNPLDDAEVAAKFRRLATPTITEQQCAQTLDLLWSLESLDDLDEVLDSLVV
jgi:2-methylcitrate dehydratase